MLCSCAQPAHHLYALTDRAPSWQVLASYGHVRDLPAKAGSVLPEQDFAMLWEQSAASQPRLKELAAAVKHSDVLVLATDPDREGEAISWHVQEELQVLAPSLLIHVIISESEVKTSNNQTARCRISGITHQNLA